MANATFWDVMTKKEIEVNGEPKDLWFKVGVVKVTPYGRKYLQLYHQPHTDFFVFEPQEDELPEID